MNALRTLLLAIGLLGGCALADQPPHNPDRGSELLARAEHSGRAEDYSRAGAALCAAINAGDDRPTTIRDLAAVHGRTGRVEDAAALLLDGLKRHPKAVELHAKLGYIYRYAGLPEQSITAYRRAQSLDPRPANLIDTQDQIAKAQIYLGDLEGARQSHLRVRELAASSHAEIDEKMLFYEGIVALYGGRREQAVALFDASFARDPASLWSAFAQAYKAAVLSDSGSLKIRAAALEAGPVADGERRYRLVHLYAQAGDRQRALGHLAGAIDAGFFDAAYIARDPLTVRLHESAAFRVLVDRAAARGARFCKLVNQTECAGRKTS